MLLFAFQTLTSGWFLIVCLIAAAGLTYLLYKKATQFQRPWNFILPAFRFTGLFFLFLLLLSPFVVLTVQQEEKPTLLVYLDKSASVNSETNEVFEQKLKKTLLSLQDKFNVRTYSFSDKIYQSADTVKGFNATDLGQIATHINNYRDSRSVSAVLIISDGIQNRGVSPLVQPLHSNPLLYCIGLGDTTPVTDIRISGVQVNESVFLGSEFTLEAQLQCDAALSSAYKVNLWEGTTLIQSQAGVFDKGVGYKRISFALKGKSPGLKQYRVEVSSIPGEKNLANNQATAVTEVVDDRKKITLVMGASHPDIGAIRRLLEGNARYQISMADPGLTPNPESADIFVVHGMPLNENQAEWLKKLVDAGKPFFHVSSLQTRRSLLGGLPGGMYPSSASQAEDVLPQAVTGFSEISFEPEALRRVESFPPLKVAYGRWQADASQKVLLKQRIGNVETDYPLFYFKDVNSHRSVWICGEGFWRWRLKEFANHGDCMATESLLFQSLQYLAVSGKPKTFALKSSKNEYEPDESAVLQATWLDAAGNRDNKAACDLTLNGEKGFKRVMQMARYNNIYRLETTGLPTGQYKATARLDKNPAIAASTVFFVTSMVAETAQKRADHGLLRQWAARYGGVFANRNAMEGLMQNLEKQETARPVVYSETKITELIHAKWFFLIIILCFSLEWIFRKYLGGY